MDSIKKTRCLRNKSKLVKNDMNVFSDSDDDKSVVSSTTTTTFKSFSTDLDIIVHKPCRLANSMSIESSDSDSDFVDSTQFTRNKISTHKKNQISNKKYNRNIIKVEVNTPQRNRKNLKCNSPHSTKSKISNKNVNKETPSISSSRKTILSPKSQQIQTPKIHLEVLKDKSPKTSSKIKVISNERVNIPVTSLKKNKIKNNDISRKSRVARNIFESTSSTNKTKCIGTQTNRECEESRNIFESTASTSKTKICTGTQTNGKTQESRNIFKSTASTSKTKICTGTQTNGKSQESKNIFALTSSTSKTKCTGTQTNPQRQRSRESDELVCSSSSCDKINVEIQTDNDVFNSTNASTASTSNINLKRPHNVATQTEAEEISSDEEKSEDEEPPKRRVIQIQVSPPKRFKTIHEECPILRLVDEHKNKIEAAKLNLTQLFSEEPSTASKIVKRSDHKNKIEAAKANLTKHFSEEPSTSSKIVKRSEHTSVKIQKSVAKNCPTKTPMKQLQITNFCKNISNTTPKNSPVKSTPSTSPTKSTPSKSPTKLKKTPEKKDTRYTQENHNRVFENVKKIVYWVFENNHFSILFTKPETDLLKKLFEFPDQRLTILCIRLYTRQHKWYNLPNLCEELNLTNDGFNLREFYTTLASDFVCTDYSKEKIELLLDYLTIPDIQAICRSFKIIRAPTKKEDKINKLLEYSTKQCTLTSLKRADQILRDRVTEKLGLCVKLELNVKNVLYRVHLLYSLTNPDLETANDIYNLMNRIRTEVVKYPKVKIDSPLLFSGRQDFLKYANACVLRQEFIDQITKKNIINEYLLCVEAFRRLKDTIADEDQIEFDKKKPLFLRRFTAPWVYCKVLTSGSQNLGKQYSKEVCEWLTEMLKQEVYCIRSRGHWYSQLALVTRAHKKDISGEVQSIIDGLSDKHTNEVQKYELSTRGSKIRKGKISQMLYDQLQVLLLPEIDVPISRTIKANVVHNNEQGRKLRYVRTTEEGTEYNSVEQTAINYYTEEDTFTHGIHCEGQLFDALFHILFWDIIYYVHIPNTFITELQDRPLDLFSGEFYSNRIFEIKTRLKHILDDWTLDKICEFASKIYSKHTLEIKSLINFDFVQEDTFHVIIRCIGKKLLAAILERFAKDYKQFHSGLPDLFLWNYRELKCCFVEVKSENDRLSTKQILWINYLHEFGAKVEVCHVEHIGSRSTKKIKPKKGSE